jgi:hypothetical protein
MGNYSTKPTNVLYLANQTNMLKSKKGTSGNKARATLEIMNHLEKQMNKRGVSQDDIMQFEYDFLEQNGIAVPDSFWIKRKSVFEVADQFWKEKTIKADKNISGKDYYCAYKEWCIKQGEPALNKGELFAYLKRKGLMSERGRVNDCSIHNVILQRQIK